VTADLPPIGVVLAGGRGRRLGGVGKASLQLAGRPLFHYPLRALLAVFADLAVVAKPDSRVLPLPGGVDLWIEPDRPNHPLVGIVEALRRADGRPVFVCAADMPLIEAHELRAILLADDLHRHPRAVAVVPRAGGRLQPLCALYRPETLPAFARAGAHAALTRVVEGLAPLIVDRPDAHMYLNVNTRPELEAAQVALLGGRGAPGA
jgi:molybdopterin-guanine dinucleotide biosynthesis protein A